MPFMRTPWTEGMRPVIRLARLGMQTGLATWQLSNAAPRRARPSIAGVLSTGWP